MTTEHWPLPGSFTTAVLSVTVLMDVVVVLFAMTMLVVHSLSGSGDSASAGAVLGLFGAPRLLPIMRIALALIFGGGCTPPPCRRLAHAHPGTRPGTTPRQ